MRIIERRQLHRALDRIASQHPDKAGPIVKALTRRRVSALLEIEINELREGVGGPLTDFFEWCIAHADEIISIITRIIDMFSRSGQPEGEA